MEPSLKVTIIAKFLQMITCLVVWPDYEKEMVILVVYASNSAEERMDLWAELLKVSSSQIVCSLPWVVLGDFNQILDPSEHSMPPSLNVPRRIREFKEYLLDADLSDLNYRGNSFTWWNKNSLRPVAKKLDRILVNDRWQCEFPNVVASFGSPGFLDHASLSIVFEPHIERLKKPFRFYNFMLANVGFFPMIMWLWYSANVVGSAMYKVSQKLSLLKNPIRDFNKTNYSHLEKRVSEAHDHLLTCQNNMLSHPNQANAIEEQDAIKRWQVLSVAEEHFTDKEQALTGWVLVTAIQGSSTEWLSIGTLLT